MIRLMLYTPSTRELRLGDIELLKDWQSKPDTLLWADFIAHDKAQERNLLSETFALHPMAIQDAQRDRHPPKLEAFDDHVFLLLKGLGAHSEAFEFTTVQLALFIGQRFLLTRRVSDSPSIDRLWQMTQEDPALLARGVDALALKLSRIVIDRYLNKLLNLEPRLEELEQIMLDQPDDTMLTELIGYKSQLRKFRRLFLYHVQIFSQLKGDAPAPIRAELSHEILDVFEQQERASSLANLYYELASDLIEGYISLASHRLNNIIKVLTIITAVFVPLSFLAGVYGMNFDNMPELHSKAGYFILLSVMAGIASLLLFLFKRKRWL